MLKLYTNKLTLSNCNPICNLYTFTLDFNKILNNLLEKKNYNTKTTLI